MRKYSSKMRLLGNDCRLRQSLTVKQIGSAFCLAMESVLAVNTLLLCTRPGPRALSPVLDSDKETSP